MYYSHPPLILLSFYCCGLHPSSTHRVQSIVPTAQSVVVLAIVSSCSANCVKSIHLLCLSNTVDLAQELAARCILRSEKHNARFWDAQSAHLRRCRMLCGWRHSDNLVLTRCIERVGTGYWSVEKQNAGIFLVLVLKRG